MSGIKIPVGAEFDQSGVDAQLRAFEQRINALGRSIAQANKQQFSPITKGTVEEVTRVTQAYERLLKVSTGLSSRIKATGQTGKGFGDLDWSSMYADARMRNRQMQKAYEYVVGSAFQAAAPTPKPAPGGGGGGGKQPPAPPPAQPPRKPGPTWGSTGMGVVQSGMQAMGPAGGVASGALGAGMASGFGAGLMGLVGGLAALGIGKAVGAVMEKVGAAEREAIGYDQLKRQVGDVSASFDMLRATVRKSAADLNVNNDEAQRLAQQFARMANVGPGGASGIGAEVSIGGGLARSLGLDLGQGVGFSASMRNFGVTSDETSSRRMALIVGETIARSSGFAKAGEILQAIAGFTEQQTRMGLNSANVPGYSGYLAAAMGSGIPGLDPAGAAGLLSRVNSSVASGGGSEASQNFYGYLGNALGLDPLQMAVLREQGAFGSGRKAFGAGSVYGRFAAANGLSTPGMANSDQMTITAVMDQLRQQYGSNPLMMANAMQNLFGVNLTQSMAFSSLSPKELGGMESRLGRFGLKLENVDSSSMSLLGQIESGDRNGLALVAQELAGRTGKRALTGEEQSKLQGAWDSGNDEGLRDTLAGLVAKYGQTETEGEQTRNSIAAVERAVQDFATKLIPINEAMRTGILFLAGGKDGKSSQQVLMEAESNDRKAGIKASFKAARADLDKREESARIRSLGVPLEGERVQDVPVRQEAAWAEMEALRKERAQLKVKEVEQIEAESKRLVEALEKETLAAEKRRQAYDKMIAEGDKGGSVPAVGNPAARFPTTGNPSYDRGGMPAGPAVSVTPQAGHVVNPELASRRGYRNNNPGNIEAGAKFNGFVGSDGRFGKYATPELGYRALGKQLLRYQTHHNRNTVREIINRWAPPSENNTGAYVNLVAKQLGVSPDAPLDLNQQETLYGLVRAIAGHENGGQLHSPDTIRAGVNMALGGGAMPDSKGAGSGGPAPLGSGLFSPQPIGGTFTHKFELSADAQRMFNPLPPVQTQFGQPMPSGTR